jgi:hypothetical protein
MIELYIKCPKAECTNPPSNWQWGDCKHKVYLCEDGDVRNNCNKYIKLGMVQKLQ